MTNQVPTYCEDCGQKRPTDKAIKIYCEKHLAEHTQVPQEDNLQTQVSQLAVNMTSNNVKALVLAQKIDELLSQAREEGYKEGKIQGIKNVLETLPLTPAQAREQGRREGYMEAVEAIVNDSEFAELRQFLLNS